MIGAVVGAVIGGAVGAAIWAAVGYYTGYEVGYVAWGVGVLAGLGANVGSNVLGKGPGTATGILAAIVALAAVGAGKFAVIEMHYQNDADLALASEFTDEVQMTYIADQVAEEWEEDGEAIDWPELPDNQWSRWRQQDYPPDLWATAVEWWNDHSPEEQAEIREGFREFHEANVRDAEEFYADMGSENFLSGFDALWILFAVGSAFGIGRGGGDE
jgi:hypothetical protein